MSDKLDGIKVQRSVKTTLNSGEVVTANMTIDYTGSTIKDVAQGDARQRIIDGQKQWRKMSKTEFEEKVNGKTLLASTIGMKVKSEAEVRAEMKANYDSASVEGKKEIIEMLQGRVSN